MFACPPQKLWRSLETLSLFRSLNPDDPLLDSDDISRYCTPTRYDRRACEPKLGAFEIDRSDLTISINRLQYHQQKDKADAIDLIRSEMVNDCYDLSPNGRFIVFNVGQVKRKLAATEFADLEITYTPRPPVDSHSSIKGFTADHMDKRTEIATDLKLALTPLISETFHGKLADG